ncbi:MAG: FG-GAP repeat domain-containing protein, partial [Baekduiaceae bacterium]
AAAPAPEVDLAAATDLEIVGFETPGGREPFLLPAGDVNGDGRRDISIVALGSVPDGVPRSWVVFGSATRGVVDLRNLGGRGIAVTLDDGAAVTNIPPLVGWDVNGDGRRDAVGLDQRPDARLVVRYQTDDGRFDDPAQGFAVEGAALGGIADLNGDGAPELLLVIPRGEFGGDYVLLEGDPSRTGTLDADDLRDEGRVLLSEPSYERELSLIPAGDVDGDGVEDGALNFSSLDGSSYTTLVFSRPSVDLATLDIAAPGSAGYRVTATKGSAQHVGDINGDGRADLLVPLYPTWTVVFGSAATTGVDALAPGSRGFRYAGVKPDHVMQGVGDFDGDGRDDVAVTGTRDGGALLFGRASGLAYPTYRADEAGFSSLEAPGLLLRDPGRLVRSADRLGDVSGDGVDDLAWTSLDWAQPVPARLRVLFGEDTGPELAARLSPTTFRVGSQPFWLKRGSTLWTTLSEAADVRVEVRDLLNRVVATETHQDVPEGTTSRAFSGTVGGRRLGSGIYTALIRATDEDGVARPDRRITFTIAG